jgi:hypothetical protein
MVLVSICCDKALGSGFAQADELRSKYVSISQEEAEAGWKEVYEASLHACMHGPYCQHGSDCQVHHHHHHHHHHSADLTSTCQQLTGQHVLDAHGSEPERYTCRRLAGG